MCVCVREVYICAFVCVYVCEVGEFVLVYVKCMTVYAKCVFVYAKCVFVSVFKVEISEIRSVNSMRKHDVSVNADSGAGVCIIV